MLRTVCWAIIGRLNSSLWIINVMSETEQNPVPQDPAAEGEDTSVGDESPSVTASPSASAKDKKIEILLKATGDAPIMKKKKWTVDPMKRVGWIASFIKKYLKYEPTDSIFLYINQSFSPSPDTEIGTLYDCFGSDGQLVIHYCKTAAWG